MSNLVIHAPVRNKICYNLNPFSGLGLVGWSPVSFGVTLGEKKDDTEALFTKIMNRVN